MKQILIATVAAMALSLPAISLPAMAADKDNIPESKELQTKPVEQPAAAEYKVDKGMQRSGAPRASGNQKGEIVTGPVEQPSEAEYGTSKDHMGNKAPSTTGAAGDGERGEIKTLPVEQPSDAEYK